VWDEEIIDFEKLSYSEYANYLSKINEDDIKTWEKGSFLDWSKESMELRPKVYDLPENKSLGYEYSFKVKPIIEQRLKQAGVRLAYVLNRVFDGKKIDKVEVDNHKKIMENI
jgi:hypothetical protein